jgi:hypothetical protein
LALLYDTYVPAKGVFNCPSTTDNCRNLQPGSTFQAHGAQSPGDQRQTSYAYDDTRGVNTSCCIVIAGDAPPMSPSRGGTGNRAKNSDNHGGDGQNVLYYGVDTVRWLPNTMNPEIDGDDIYEVTTDRLNPGASDSYISQIGGDTGGSETAL